MSLFHSEIHIHLHPYDHFLNPLAFTDSFLFLIVGEKPLSSGSTSNISSPFLNGVSFLGHCIAFNYAVIGSGELQLSVFVEGENGSTTLLRKLDISGKWKRATIPLRVDDYYNPFKVSLILNT